VSDDIGEVGRVSQLLVTLALLALLDLVKARRRSEIRSEPDIGQWFYFSCRFDPASEVYESVAVVLAASCRPCLQPVMLFPLQYAAAICVVVFLAAPLPIAPFAVQQSNPPPPLSISTLLTQFFRDWTHRNSVQQYWPHL